jgi:RNA polymerase sigma-70 factor (ECF subfamily)
MSESDHFLRTTPVKAVPHTTMRGRIAETVDERSGLDSALGVPVSDQDSQSIDPQRFLRLFMENERRVYGFIASLLPNMVDADDVLQETSLVLWQKFDQFRIGSDFTAWACRIAQIQVLRFYERKGRSKLRFDLETLETIAAETLSMGPLLESRHHALTRCLEEMTDRDRDILRRRYAEDATPQQIAGEVGRSIHAIYKALSRIHDGLLKCIRGKLEVEKE